MSEYIIKYSGDISSLPYPLEILSDNYAILEINAEEALQVSHYRGVEYLEPSQKLFLSSISRADYSCIRTTQEENGPDLSGDGVIVGIIDSGIDLAHREFQTPDGKTRILSLWDMTLTGDAPTGFYKGTEYCNHQIDDGSAISQDTIGHGTAIAGIAAGKSGAAPNAAILAVKLGESDPRTTDVMRGIKYIVDGSRQLAMPCVINLSYGTNNGSHRGQSLFETYIDEMSQKWKVLIVCASGNEGDSGHHFQGRLTKDRTLNVNFAVASYSGNVYLTLWKNFSDTVSYELILPNGTSTGKINALSRSLNVSLGGINVSVVYGEPNHYSTAQEVYFLLEDARGTMEGIWTLLCHGEDIVDGLFDIWLPTVEEVPKGTAFLIPSTDMTMTLPSTAQRPLSVGGYRAETNTLSIFSGRGGAIHGGAVQLDLVAPAENIYTAKSGGGYDVYTGTSVAAPFATGAAALLMEWGIVRGNDPFLYGQRIKAFLCKNATRNSYLNYPNPLWGYGLLNLCGIVDELENYVGR